MPTGVKQQGRKKPVKQLPKFQNTNEMAEFFDTVDSTQLPWEDTDLKFERPKMIQVSIRIPEEDLVKIRHRAVKLGIGHTALMRMMLHRSVATGNDIPPKGSKRRAVVK